MGAGMAGTAGESNLPRQHSACVYVDLTRDDRVRNNRLSAECSTWFGGLAMRAIGIVLTGIGVIWLLIAFNFYTGVETEYGAVENLGLIARRQNHLFVAGLVTLIGALLTIFGHASAIQAVKGGVPESGQAALEAPTERDLASDPYRLWLAQKYSIARNELFSRFVFGQQTFNSLDDALIAAHDLETKALEVAAREDAGIAEGLLIAENERQVRYEEEQARYKAQDRKFLMRLSIGGGIVLIISAPFLFSAVKDAAALRETDRLAEAKRINQVFEPTGIEPDPAWYEVKDSIVKGGSDTVWCAGNTGRLFEFYTRQSPNDLIDKLTIQ